MSIVNADSGIASKRHLGVKVANNARALVAALVICAGYLAPVSIALAQGPAAPNIPEQQPGASPFSAQMVRNAVEIRDTRTGRALLAPTHHPLLDGFGAGITSSTTFQTQPEGVDVIVRLTNTSNSSQQLGKMQFGIFNLGEEIDYLWSRMNAEMRPAQARSHVGQAWMYPSDLYSPVMVMRNQEVAVGVSLQYPLMEYRHDVRVSVASPGNWAEQGEAGRGWFLSFDFRNFGGETVYTRMQHQGAMAAGEVRTYVVSIRVTSLRDEWIRTLLPYRDYFRSTYGAVRYERAVTPIRAYNLADTSHLSESNRLGFSPHQRPDLRGFGPVVRDVAAKNWDEAMFWTPAGLYYENRQLNWPYHMASTLDDSPGLNTAFSATDGFPWLVNQGTRVGFWWGRSTDYIEYFDGAVSVPFDPSNPAHVAGAFAEMDNATRAGATVIGLDTFTPEHTPMWSLLPWLETMMTRYPNVKFVTEPSQCDILHTHAATWYDGWLDITGTTTDRNDLFHLKGPNVLSDFMNPGNESWVGLGYRPPYRRSFGTPSNAQIMADLHRHADWGYRLAIGIDMPQPDGVDAGASWETTLPADIRDSDPFIANIRAGRRPGEAAQPQPQPQPTPPPAPTGTDTGNPNPNPTGTGTDGTGGGGTPNPGTGSGGTGNGGPGNPPNPNDVIVVVNPPTNPPSGGGSPQGGGNPPDGQSTSNQYNTGNSPTPAPTGGTTPPGTSGSQGNGAGTGSGSTPPAPNATGNRPASRMFGGTSRRSTATAVVVPTNRMTGGATRSSPRPAPINGPVTPPSVSPPNQNPQPVVSQPRVSLPNTSASQAGGALRRRVSSDAAGTRSSGVTRKQVAPSRSTSSPSTGVQSTSNGASRSSSPQGGSTTTVTNTPPQQPQGDGTQPAPSN